MLRSEIKDIDTDNPFYYAEVISGDRTVGVPKHNGYRLAARSKEQAVLLAIGAVPVSELEGGVQLLAVNIYRVSGKSKVVTPSELHVRVPSFNSITNDIWLVSTEFDLVDLDKAVYQAEHLSNEE